MLPGSWPRILHHASSAGTFVTKRPRARSRRVPYRPGLGIAVDEEVVRRFSAAWWVVEGERSGVEADTLPGAIIDNEASTVAASSGAAPIGTAHHPPFGATPYSKATP